MHRRFSAMTSVELGARPKFSPSAGALGVASPRMLPLFSALRAKHRTAFFVAKLAQAVAVLVPILSTLDRFRRPFGEKFMFPYLGGSADLWLPYLGAQAITEHLDPYGALPMHLHEPSNWPATYPPTMLALYVPLVWATNANIEAACQVFYWINMVALGALSWIVWRLSLRLMPIPERTESPFLVIFIALSLNALTMFAIDRNQSEIVSATLCWGAILLYLKEYYASAMVLVTLAGAIKGYAVPVGFGLLVMTPKWKPLFRALGATTAVALAVTLPVAKYLKHGFQSMLLRTDYAWSSVWYNHSFKNAFYQHGAKLGDAGRRFMIFLTLAIAFAALARLVQASTRGNARQVTLRIVAFAGAALALMIGIPAFAGPYNYVLVLPALILLATRYHDVADILELKPIFALLLGAGLTLALFWALELRSEKPFISRAADALVIFVLCLGSLTAVSGRRRARAVADLVSGDRSAAPPQ